MIPEELEKLILRHKSEGHLPFFVNCTTGTTVYGAFDPINPIADICERHHIWLHIDVSLFLYFFVITQRIIFSFFFQAAWGGGLLMSKKYKALRFAGIERYVLYSTTMCGLLFGWGYSLLSKPYKMCGKS